MVWRWLHTGQPMASWFHRDVTCRPHRTLPQKSLVLGLMFILLLLFFSSVSLSFYFGDEFSLNFPGCPKLAILLPLPPE